jgi:hypothetical protein
MIINNKIIILLCATVLINYFTPIPYIGFDFTRRHNFLNRLYLSLFSGFIIVLTDVFINTGNFTNVAFISWILFLTVGIITSYYFISNQILISETDYLLTMRENHLMDLHIAESISSHNIIKSDAKEYTTKIVSTRTNELENVNKILRHK